jgi:hemerythrin
VGLSVQAFTSAISELECPAMQHLEWRPDLSVVVEFIDQQHQELFKRFNDLVDAGTRGESQREVAKVIAFLESYALTHFWDEELLMEATHYPGLLTHKAEHTAFMCDVQALRQRLEIKGSTPVLAAQVQARVANWLIAHIGGSDKKLGHFIAACIAARGQELLVDAPEAG